MIAFIRQVCAVLVAFAIVAMLPVVLAVGLLFLPHAPVPHGTWLVLELHEPLLEHYAPPTVSDLLHESPPCLMEVVENLEKAAIDDHIVGVFFDLDGFAAGAGKIDEIRDGIRDVRAAGKKVVAYANEYSDGSILLASECETASLFPKGTAYFLGSGATIEHLKGSLEKLGVRENIHRIDEYKSAAELFTSKESSPETIANVRWLLEDLGAAADSTLSENLDVPRDSLVALRAHGIFRGDDAVLAGLVDETIDRAELEDRLADGGDFTTISSADYSKVTRASLGLEGGSTIAVVHAQGFVTIDGDDRYEAVVGLALGADRLIDDLEEVADDDKVRAVILRYDTGGGATSGGERIAKAVARVREKKPVVVSMADEAASAGYMMSQDAHKLVCAASGITGSIGSVTGKMNLRGLYEKLGVTIDEIALSPNALIFSSVNDFTETQWKTLIEDHWELYREWIAEIAALRDMTVDEVDAVARGRVWTGRQAKERGLVDELGGFKEAVATAKNLADLPPEAHVAYVHYPPKRTLLEVVLEGDLERVARASFHVSWRAALGEASRVASGGLSIAPFRLGTRSVDLP